MALQNLTSFTLAVSSSDSAWDSLRSFAAGVLLLVLALLATSRYFYRLQRMRALAPFLGGGWVALCFGFLLGPWGIGVIADESIRSISPLLFIGVGWIGVIVGMQAQRQVLAAIPKTVWRWVWFDTLLFTVIAAAVLYPVCRAWQVEKSFAWTLPALVVLITASYGWAAETRSLVAQHTPERLHHSTLVALGSGLAAIITITVYGLASKLMHVDDAGEMRFFIGPALLRLIASVGLAFGVGLAGRFMLQQAGRSRPDALVVFLGIVGLTTGIAVELEFSPLFSSMLAGAVIANMAGTQLRSFERFILGAEQITGVLFALLAGALLDPAIGWWGLLVVVLLTTLRQVIKPAMMRRTLRSHEPPLPADSPLRLAPIRQSVLAIAIGVAFILGEVSPYRRKLLAVIVLVGLLCELLPLINATIARWRQSNPSTDSSDSPALERES